MAAPTRRGSPAVMLVSGGVMAAVVAAVVVDACAGDPEPPAPQVLPAVAPLAALPAAVPAARPAPEPAMTAPAPASTGPALVVHNPCQQALLLALNHQDAEGRRATSGFYRVEPGARLVPATRSGPIALYHGTLHYYTETPDTEPVETGRRSEVVGDRELAMKSAELDPAAPTALVLECPGMTSGRP